MLSDTFFPKRPNAANCLTLVPNHPITTVHAVRLVINIPWNNAMPWEKFLLQAKQEIVRIILANKLFPVIRMPAQNRLCTINLFG